MFWLQNLALQWNQTTCFTRGRDGTNTKLSMLIDMTNVPKISHQIMTDVIVMSFIIWCGNIKIKYIIIGYTFCVNQRKNLLA